MGKLNVMAGWQNRSAMPPVRFEPTNPLYVLAMDHTRHSRHLAGHQMASSTFHLMAFDCPEWLQRKYTLLEADILTF